MYDITLDLRMLFSLILISLASNALGFLISAASRDKQTALIITPLVLLPLLLLGGLYVNTESPPAFISWLKYISVFYWGFSALAVAEYDTLTLSCVPGELCRFATGTDVLISIGIDPSSLVLSMSILIAMTILFTGLGFLLLWFYVKPSDLTLRLEKIE